MWVKLLSDGIFFFNLSSIFFFVQKVVQFFFFFHLRTAECGGDMQTNNKKDAFIT